ncbi:Fc.00g040060.m01.CDS01 [Cosmosporella sp. VM-42]
MSLAHHVNPEDILQRLEDAHLTPAGSTRLQHRTPASPNTPFDSKYASQASIPKYKIPEDGAPGDTIYQMIKDELALDGSPTLNLASFVNTYMESNAEKIMAENMVKNLADCDEYPAIMEIHQRVISILSHLWSVQPGEKAIGTACTGSSEGIHLGGLAMKRRWQEKRKAEGKDTSAPNIVMGANAQVALEKFARYFDVEARILPVSVKSNFRLDPDLVAENIDENTIGIFAILGSTYTGHYEPVEEISNILDKHQEKTGQDIPIHVDAASGGFVAPFADAKAGGTKWGFELPRVKSINASGHKYGLCSPGIGWVVWRDESYLPENLIFTLDYLGGEEKSFTLNFSRPGAQVIVQYYNLIHLGFQGYREIMENCLANARTLAKSLEKTGWFTVVSDIHRRSPLAPSNPDSTDGSTSKINPQIVAGQVRSSIQKAADFVGGQEAEQSITGETSAHYVAGLPVVSFRFSDEFQREFPHVSQDSLALLLRARQWIIPNYALPPRESETKILRVVVRESMSYDLIDRLLADICDSMERMMGNDQLDLSLLQNKPKRLRLRDEKEEERKKIVVGEATNDAEKMMKGIYKGVC